MNRTAFSLPAHSEYRTRGGLTVSRSVEQFSGGASRLDDLIELLDRRRGVVLSSGTTVPGRYESFDLGFSDPPLCLETTGSDFSLQALNARGEVLIAFLRDTSHQHCVVISEKNAPGSPVISCTALRRSTKNNAPGGQRDVAGARHHRGTGRQ